MREGEVMPRKRFTVEQIINHLREADVLVAQGRTVGEICRRIGVSEQSYYRWRREYGGLKVDQARRLKDLERENARLKRAVADLTLEKLVLKEAAEGNF
jgi:putative transposase